MNSAVLILDGAAVRRDVDARWRGAAASRARRRRWPSRWCCSGLGFVFMVIGARRSDGGALVSPVLALARLHVPHLRRALPLAGRPVAGDQAGAAEVRVAADGRSGSSPRRSPSSWPAISASLTDKIARGELFHLFGGQADFYLIFVRHLGRRRRCCSCRLGPGCSDRCRGAMYDGRRDAAPGRAGGASFRGRASRRDAAADSDAFAWLETGDAPGRAALDGEPERGDAQGAGPAARRGRRWSSVSGGSSRSARSARRCRTARANDKAGQDRAATSTPGATASRTRRCSTCATGSTAPTASLVDVNRDRADGTRALDWWFPSDDGGAGRVRRVRRRQRGVDRCACATSPAARSRRRRSSRTRACSLAWTPDGSGFYYTRYPRPGEVPAGEMPYHRGVFFHRLGDDPAQGPQALRRRARSHRLARRRPLARRTLAGDHGQRRAGRRARSYLHDAARRRSRRLPVATGEEALFHVVEVLDDRSTCRRRAARRAAGCCVVDPRTPGARAGGRSSPSRAQGTCSNTPRTVEAGSLSAS